jgi:hypothetical protein
VIAHAYAMGKGMDVGILDLVSLSEAQDGDGVVRV